MTPESRPRAEEVARALMLADEENENSISFGKNFNSGAWSKVILAAECRYLQSELKEAESHLLNIHGLPMRDCKNAVAIIRSVLDRAEKAESELAKTKQEFERFAERAALEMCRKDQEITKLKAEILGLMEENERLDTNSGKTGRGEKK